MNNYLIELQRPVRKRMKPWLHRELILLCGSTPESVRLTINNALPNGWFVLTITEVK